MRCLTHTGRIASIALALFTTLDTFNLVFAQPLELNPVVVTATRFEIPLSDVLPSTSVITREQIESSQATTLADLLQGQAGVEFARNGGPGSLTSFFLRGQNSTNMVMLVDGVKVQTDSIGTLALTEFPLPLIEKIEILRGNAGALYGESAIGGVISIHTRQAGTTPQSFGSATVGSYQSADVNAGYNSADSNGLRFNFVMGHNQSKGFSAMNPSLKPPANPDRDGYRNDYLQGKVDKVIDPSLTIGGRFSLIESALDFDDEYWSSTANPAQPTDTHRSKKKNDSLGVYVKKQLSTDWLMRVDVSTTSLRYRDFRNDQQPTAGDGSGRSGTMTGEQRAIKWSSLWQANAQTIVNFGVDSQHDTYVSEGDNSYDTKRTQRTLQGFFTGLNRQWDRLSLQLNARHDNLKVVSEDFSGIETENITSSNTGLLGLGWRLTPQWRLTSAVSSGFKAPTAYDQMTNPNLKPERHFSQEAGLVYSSQHTLSKVVYFESTGRDVVVYPPPFYNSKNIGETRNKGWEATTQSNWGPYKLRFAAVFQDPWNVTDNEALARRAKQYGSADISRYWLGYDLGVRLYASGMRQESKQTPPLPVMGGYALWSFYVGRRLDNEWSAQVKLDNVFDRHYQLAYGYHTPGRGVYATLRYQPKP